MAKIPYRRPSRLTKTEFIVLLLFLTVGIGAVTAAFVRNSDGTQLSAERDRAMVEVMKNQKVRKAVAADTTSTPALKKSHDRRPKVTSHSRNKKSVRKKAQPRRRDYVNDL